MAELNTLSLLADANLKAYYRLEGNSNDSKGSNNGTDTAISYTTTNAKYGQAASFNGSSSKIIAARAMSVTDNFTLCGWVYINSLPQAATFFGLNGGASHFGYSAGIGGATVDSSGSNLVVNYPGVNWLDTGITLTAGVKTHIAFIRSSGTTQAYVNGVAVGSTMANTPLSPDGSFAMGSLYAFSSASSFFSGLVDDVAYFDRVLTPTEILTLVTDSLTAKPAFLLNLV